MTIASASSRFVIELLPAAFFISLPFIGALFIEYDPRGASAPFSTEKDSGETLGRWGKLNWVLTPWSVMRTLRG